MDWRERISVNPRICHGSPCIKGTRIMVWIASDNLAGGVSPEVILREYPSLVAEDLQAAHAYAAEIVREEEVLLPKAASA